MPDAQLIMEIMNGAPKYWAQIIDTLRIRDPEELQALIQYHEDTLRSSSSIDPKVDDLEKRLCVLENTRTFGSQRDHESAQRGESHAMTVGSHPKLPKPTHPPDDSTMSRKHLSQWVHDLVIIVDRNTPRRAGAMLASTDPDYVAAQIEYEATYAESESDSEAEGNAEASEPVNENSDIESVEKFEDTDPPKDASSLFIASISSPDYDSSPNPPSEASSQAFAAIANNPPIIKIPEFMACPPGTSFLSAKPTTITARIGQLEAEAVQVIADSGAKITLISSQYYHSMNPKPCMHKGLEVKIRQVRDDAEIDMYIQTHLFIQTDKTVYRISILRCDDGTTLTIVDEYSVKCDDFVISDEMRNEVKALAARAVESHDRKAIRTRCKAQRSKIQMNKFVKNGLILVAEKVSVPPNCIKRIRICIPWREGMNKGYIYTQSRTTLPLGLSDILLTRDIEVVPVQNHSDRVVHLQQGEPLGKLKDPRRWLDKRNHVLSKICERVKSMSNWTMTAICHFQQPEPLFKPIELKHANKVPDIEGGPKTSETPDPDVIPQQELLAAVDFNPSLSSSQRLALKKLVLEHHHAFGLDDRLGHYPVKVEINLKPDTKPVSQPPYSGSPLKCEIIDKKLDAWFAAGVIQASKSPWGAPVIIVFQKGKLRLCVDYRQLNDMTKADEYPLPKQSDILQALSGAQWLSSFDALSGFTQLEIIPEHREQTAFRTHRGLHKF
ncbi:SubName: Full=Related to TY3B-TY3B protein {ECO:0000313/EMBL:CCA76077.1} [Serendipita indica DSM 11827]|nr:SubName: Full=Related to TY3B-TY3B protein {ECO:0000313/EMBL:CCA76077.1} [Serendipita indica DSM 11827]